MLMLSRPDPTCDQVLSLMYHNVCRTRFADGSFPGFNALSPSITSYFVDEETFDSQCRMIAESGRAIRFDALRHRSATPSSAGPRVLLTFDDGWLDSVHVGGPILESHGLTAMLFVTTELIGLPDFVRKETLQKLSSTFTVGSHARTHRLLADLPDDQVRMELQVSKLTLEDILGSEVDTLAYPGGSYDPRVQRIAQEIGYRWIFTSEPTISRIESNSLRIGRVAVKSDTSIEAVSRWLTGDVRAESRRAMALATAKRIMGRRLYRTVRTRLLNEQTDHLEMTDLVHHSPPSV
ncbi:MAG: polysaccharide deacetylase family protein [Planctomycetaceae bacterium]|nr:polysaccharide deacetylase family protein [Planctomycetaceae bacterium]